MLHVSPSPHGSEHHQQNGVGSSGIPFNEGMSTSQSNKLSISGVHMRRGFHSKIGSLFSAQRQGTLGPQGQNNKQVKLLFCSISVETL